MPTSPVDPGSLVGVGSGPPAPPSVPGSRIDILAEPATPGPGATTLLTVTLSGSSGGDRYAVPGAAITLALTEKPDESATISAASVTTDVTGSASAKLTLSKTKGRHVLKATGGSASAQMIFDTLAGSRASGGRSRHSAGILTPGVPPMVSPAILIGAAGLFLVGGFLFPYRDRLPGLSSGKKRRPAPRSATPGG